MSGNAHASHRLLGRLRLEEGKGTVSIEERFDTPPANIWSALTVPDRLTVRLGEVAGALRLGGSSTRTSSRADRKALVAWRCVNHRAA